MRLCPTCDGNGWVDEASDEKLRLRTARESVGWLNSVGPLDVAPSIPEAPAAAQALEQWLKRLPVAYWPDEHGVASAYVRLADIRTVVEKEKKR